MRRLVLLPGVVSIALHSSVLAQPRLAGQWCSSDQSVVLSLGPGRRYELKQSGGGRSAGAASVARDQVTLHGPAGRDFDITLDLRERPFGTVLAFPDGRELQRDFCARRPKGGDAHAVDARKRIRPYRTRGASANPPTSRRGQERAKPSTATKIKASPSRPPPRARKRKAGPQAKTGDVVETIDLGEATPAPAVPAPVARPAPQSSKVRFELRGWARSFTSVQTGARGFQAENPLPGRLRYDRLVNREQLYMSLRYARGKSLEVVVSGLLGLYVFEEETSAPDSSFNGFNGAATRFSFAPELREAYVGLYAGPLDLRVGQQRVAWGKGDFFRPNDIVNPRELRDPILNETELNEVPVPMVRADLALGSRARLQLLYVPFLVPHRVELSGDNWALIQPGSPDSTRQALFWAARSQDPRILLSVAGLGDRVGRRDPSFEDSSLGVRFSWSAGDVDINHYYHYGRTSLPRIDLAPQLRQALVTTDLLRTTQEAFDQRFGPLALLPVGVTYPRRHHTGIDLASTIGSFALRFEGAYQSAQVFFDRTLQPVVRDVAKTVLSLEYQTGETGKTILVEASYTRLFGSKPAERLLFFDADNFAIAVLARWTFAKWLELELRTVVGTKPRSYLLRPQIGFKRGDWSFRLGALLLAGETASFGDYYRRNGSAYANLKLDF